MFDTQTHPPAANCHIPRPNYFAQPSLEYEPATFDCDSPATADTKGRKGRNPWGNVSYADLITQAIITSPERRLTLQQIYGWMVSNVPYFKDKAHNGCNVQWKNSIRHNLSLHNRFVRMDNGWRSSWMINPNPNDKPVVQSRTPRKQFELKRSKKTDSTLTPADGLFPEILPDNLEFAQRVHFQKQPSPTVNAELIHLLQQRSVHPTSPYSKPSLYTAGTYCERAQKAGLAASAGRGKVKAAPSSTLTSSDVSDAVQAQTLQTSSSRDHDAQELPKFKHEEFIMEDYGEEEDSPSETLNDSEGIFGDAGKSYTEKVVNEDKTHEVVCTPEFIKEEPPEESPFETVFCDAPNIKQEVEENIHSEGDVTESNWDDPLEPTVLPTSQDKTAVPSQSVKPLKRGRTTQTANAKKARQAPKTFSGTVSIGPPPPPGSFDPYDSSLHNAVIGFFVSLKRIPVEKRDATKQKILELIDAIADHDLDPDWIRIMVVKPPKAPLAKNRPVKNQPAAPVKIALPNVNLPNIMLPLPQTNVPLNLPTEVLPKAVPRLLPKPQTALTEGPQPHTSIGAGLVMQPTETSMSIGLPVQAQTTNTSVGIMTQQLTSMPMNLPTQAQRINTSLGLGPQQLASVPFNLPTNLQQTSTSMGLMTQLTSLPMNLPSHPQTNTSMGLLTQQLPINLPMQLQATSASLGLVTQQLSPLPINLPPQPHINSSMSLVTQPITSIPINLHNQTQTMNIEKMIPTQMQTSTSTAVAHPRISSNTEMGVYKQLQPSTQSQMTTTAIDPPTHPPLTSYTESELPHREGPS